MSEAPSLTPSESDQDRLIRYHDALVRIANPGEDEPASQRSAEVLRDIVEKALRPHG